MADDTPMIPAPLDDAERIRVKGENAFTLPGEDSVDLSSPDEAETMVRDFLLRLNKFKGETIADPAKAKEGPAFVEAQVEQVAKLFEAVPGAADNARAFYRLTGGGDLEVLEAAFSTVAANFLNLYAADEAGQLTEAESQFRLDAIITEAVCALLGLPLDDTPDA
jgi:hypothetical protein